MTNLAPLKELVSIVGGGTPKRSRPDYYNGPIPWVTPKDMKRWDIHQSQETITKTGLEESASRLIPNGSILIVIRSGVLKHTLPIAIARRPVAINQDMKALIPKAGIDPEYIARFIQSSAPRILQWVRATTADNFPLDELKTLQVSVPPLAIQKDTAGILANIDRLRHMRHYALETCDELLPTVFLEMFGDFKSSESRWPIQSLGDSVEAFEGGINFNPVGDNDPASDWRVLKVSAVSWREFLADESKPISPTEQFGEKLIVKAGNLIMSRANTIELVGAAARVRRPPPLVLLPDKLWRLKFLTGARLLPDFVLYALRCRAVRREIERRASGTSGSMKNISKEDAASLRLPCPPLPLQQQFAKLVARHEQLRATHVEALRQAAHLFQTLLHQAFNAH
jgi:type I restriction enzyme, S subunit